MRAKAGSTALLAAVLASAGAARAEPRGSRWVVAWDVASDLVAYELPRKYDPRKSASPRSIFELRRISTGVAVDIADCEIAYSLAGGGPAPCEIGVLLRERKAFARLQPTRRGELVPGDAATAIATSKALWLPGGDGGKVAVDLAALAASTGEVRATPSHAFIVLSEHPPARKNVTIETLLRIPRAERAGRGAQRDLIEQAKALATLTVGAVGPTFLRAARALGPLDVTALSTTFCKGPDVVERLETWRRLAGDVPAGERGALEAALAAKGCFAPMDPVTYDAAAPAIQVALRWLAAVKAKERKAALDLMDAPFVARGWWDNPVHVPELAACGATNRAPPKKWPDTELRVADRTALPAAFDCLLLPEYDKRIPELVAGRWPPNRGNPWDDEVGAIFPVEPSMVSKQARRFAREAGELARGGTLLQAVAVDNNGFTFTALLVVIDGRIRAAFVHEMFEE